MDIIFLLMAIQFLPSFTEVDTGVIGYYMPWFGMIKDHDEY
jgi:hypothetical protein